VGSYESQPELSYSATTLEFSTEKRNGKGQRKAEVIFQNCLILCPHQLKGE
jgi:hypothetical protein